MRVSIIIPTYNSEATIKKAIDSALNQKFFPKDFEVIVVNDGSTDKTSEILKSYGKQIKIINQENQGAVKAANKGLKNAKGKYVIKLDSDDYFEPTILKEMVAIFEKHPEIDFVYSDYYERTVDGEIKIISTRENLFNTIAIGIMFRRKKLAEVNFYNENVKFVEYDLLLRIQSKWKRYHLPKSLFYYNRRKESLTGNKQRVKEFIDQLKKLHPKKLGEIQKIRKY